MGCIVIWILDDNFKAFPVRFFSDFGSHVLKPIFRWFKWDFTLPLPEFLFVEEDRLNEIYNEDNGMRFSLPSNMEDNFKNWKNSFKKFE